MDGNLFPLIFLVVIAGAFWMLVIRPAKRRQAEQQALVNAVAAGDRILMSSGIIGEVVERVDDDLRVQIAPGVIVTIVGQAVARVLTEPDSAESTATPAEQESAGPGTQAAAAASPTAEQN